MCKCTFNFEIISHISCTAKQRNVIVKNLRKMCPPAINDNTVTQVFNKTKKYCKMKLQEILNLIIDFEMCNDLVMRKNHFVAQI